MARDKNVIKVDLHTPIIEWRKHHFCVVDKKDFSLFKHILPHNVKSMYIHELKHKIHIKIVMYG